MATAMLASMQTIPFLTGANNATALLRDEIRQLNEEGRDPDWIRERTAGIDLDRAGRAALAELWAGLQAAPMRADFPFVEPSGLEEIRAERPAGRRERLPSFPDAKLEDRMLGAWLGRCCGCALGKPVECFMDPRQGLSSRERVKRYLQGAGPDEYPLRGYIPSSSAAVETTGGLRFPASQRENIRFMETDDDLRYTVLGQKILLEKGRGFTTRDVMHSWIYNLPFGSVFTAETQAYRNYVLRYSTHPASAEEEDWSWVAAHQNPYREWIGAQIRADSWGYAAPGNPELAAEFAWRDARLSHVKNGIYGEMLAAAMIAAAFVLDDPLAVVEAGLAEIPHRCRLAADIRQVVESCRRHGFRAEAFEAVLDEIERLVGHYPSVHTNNNAALVVAALLLGRRDFEKTVGIAVMGGWDTDCNGATAGSIFGAMHGAAAVPEKWKGPLNDTLYSEIPSYHPISIAECAKRSAAIAAAAGHS